MIELFDKAIIPIDQIVDWARPGCCTGTVSIRDNAITGNTTAKTKTQLQTSKELEVEVDVFTQFCAYV